MDEKEQKVGRYEVWTIPNILTMIRIVLIPIFVYIYIVKKSYLVTAYLIVLSGLTDLLDGYIARHFHLITDVGKFIDPLADKLTQAAAMFCLLTRFPNMIYPLVVIFIKEISALILGIIVFRKMNHLVEGADWHGKVATTVLYATFLLHLFWLNIPATVSLILIIISTGFMLLSGVLYFMRYIRTLSGKREPKR